MFFEHPYYKVEIKISNRISSGKEELCFMSTTLLSLNTKDSKVATALGNSGEQNKSIIYIFLQVFLLRNGIPIDLEVGNHL